MMSSTSNNGGGGGGNGASIISGNITLFVARLEFVHEKRQK